MKRGKQRRTHANDGSLVVQLHAVALHGGSALLDDIHNLAVKGVAKGNVADETALEKGKGADALGAVDDLVRDHKVHGLDLLLEGTDCAEGNDAAHTNVSQGGDVGTGGHLMGRKLVVSAMTGEEGNGDAVVLEDEDRGRGLAPRRLRVQLCDRGVAINLVEASTANDGNVDRAC